MLISTADAAASIHFTDAVIYRPLSESDADIRRKVEEWWFAHHIARLSDNRPEGLILGPSSIATQRLAGPSSFYPDELLNWDFAVEAAPRRPAGTLTVTLKYAGRGTPTPFEDP